MGLLNDLLIYSDDTGECTTKLDAAKYLCQIDNTINYHAVDFLTCDLNGVAYYAMYYANDKNHPQYYQKLKDALSIMGYPCCDSLQYLIHKKGKQKEKAMEYLREAVKNQEPAAEYLFAYEEMFSGNKGKAGTVLKKFHRTPFIHFNCRPPKYASNIT